MLWLRLIYSRLYGLLRKNRIEQEMDDEMRFHLLMRTRENIERGMSPDEAEGEARRRFGNLGRIKDLARDIKGGGFMETLLQDLRYGARMLRKAPGFTLVATLTLGLGIGANAAIFSLINTVFLKPLPVQDPGRLTLLTIDDHGSSGASFPYPVYAQFRDRVSSFSDIAASGGVDRLKMALSGPGAGGQAESVQAETVSGNFFSALGVNAVCGRVLTAEDDRAENPQASAVISYGFWRRRFGLDQAIVGKNIRLKDVPFTIVGVAPPGFSGFEVGRSPDLWWPLQMTPRLYPGSRILNARSSWWLRLMGRLRPGKSEAQARAELDLIFRPALAEILESFGAKRTPAERRNFLARKIELQPGGAGWTTLRKQLKQPLLILMTMVALALAVACANVANLLLARAAGRVPEIAMRLALGAGRMRLVRQLLTESALLALIGGALGLLFAEWGAGLLLAYLPSHGDLSFNVAPDSRVLGFTLAISMLTGLLFGLAPALRAARFDIVSMLKDRSIGSGKVWSRLSLNKALVATQVALSLYLLVGAGLFARSLQKLKSLDAGFDRENVVLFSLDTDYDAERRADLYQSLLDRLAALPGALSASLSSHGLLLNNTWNDNVTVEGRASRSDEDLLCYGQVVAPRFFETMGIPILSGRDFGPQDARTSGSDGRHNPARVALINQTMARYFFPNENPIGKRFSVNRPGELIEIVGVVKDAKYEALREEPLRIFYLPFFQGSSKLDTTFQVRTVGQPAAMLEMIRRAVKELDPNAPALRMRTMNDVVDESLARERFLAQFAGFFSLFAALLAAIGLYGVLSYAVTRRTNEIGVRMALGARAPDVIRMIFQESMPPVVVGVAIGLGAALGSARYVASLLYGLSPTDPSTVSLAALGMLVVAALASCWPAMRATKVDPMVALRAE